MTSTSRTAALAPRTILTVASLASLLLALVLSISQATAFEGPHSNVGIGKKAIGADGEHITSIKPGESFRYRIVVFNSGDIAAEDVTVVDDLDDGLVVDGTFFDVDTAASGGTGSCDVGAGNVITCHLGTLGPKDGTSDSGFVRINVTVAEDACGPLTNQATVSASNEPVELNKDNVSEVVTVDVECATETPAQTPEQTVSAGTPHATPASTPEDHVQGGTGTPAPSQPDTATLAQGGASPIPTLVFGLILVASSLTLGLLNLQALRHSTRR